MRLARVLKLASRGIILSRQRTTKVLIRLRGCKVLIRLRWWALICAFVVRIWHKQFFSWRGSTQNIEWHYKMKIMLKKCLHPFLPMQNFLSYSPHVRQNSKKIMHLTSCWAYRNRHNFDIMMASCHVTSNVYIHSQASSSVTKHLYCSCNIKIWFLNCKYWVKSFGSWTRLMFIKTVCKKKNLLWLFRNRSM